MKKELLGGRLGKIYQEGAFVVRPVRKWTKNVHDFLRYLRQQEIEFVPEPFDLNEQTETISFMVGEVYNYPLPSFFFTDGMIISAAKLLRKFHDAGVGYLGQLNGDEEWMMPITSAMEVMCHGDFAPYNVTIMNREAQGMIDFDTLHPGSRIEDVAYAAYRWVPFSLEDNKLTLEEKIQRTKLFLEAYGLSKAERFYLVKQMNLRLQRLMDFMLNQAEQGDKDFQRNISDGHLEVYKLDAEYLRKHEEEIVKGIQ